MEPDWELRISMNKVAQHQPSLSHLAQVHHPSRSLAHYSPFKMTIRGGREKCKEACTRQEQRRRTVMALYRNNLRLLNVNVALAAQARERESGELMKGWGYKKQRRASNGLLMLNTQKEVGEGGRSSVEGWAVWNKWPWWKSGFVLPPGGSMWEMERKLSFSSS